MLIFDSVVVLFTAPTTAVQFPARPENDLPSTLTLPVVALVLSTVELRQISGPGCAELVPSMRAHSRYFINATPLNRAELMDSFGWAS